INSSWGEFYVGESLPHLFPQSFTFLPFGEIKVRYKFSETLVLDCVEVAVVRLNDFALVGCVVFHGASRSKVEHRGTEVTKRQASKSSDLFRSQSLQSVRAMGYCGPCP